MDEEKKVEQNNIDQTTKETIANQLNSFINPGEKIKNTTNSVSYYSGSEIKTEPLIKVSSTETAAMPQKQNRPIVRTYKSDVEETIQSGHISSINMAMAQNKKMMSQVAQTEIETKKRE